MTPRTRRRTKSEIVDDSEEKGKKYSTSSTNTPEEKDTTLQFFYKPHTISALILMLCIFLYVALYVTDDPDWNRNIKVGLSSNAMVLIIIGLLMFQDGPFIRPHPALWRIVLAVSVVYELFLVFLLFQNVQNARKLFGYFDSTLGVPLPEKSYADDCSFTWENVRSQLDEFVLAHFFGWFAKAIMLRDYWICWILSILFEFLEYSLQHQLPNFAECWWDHWILDVLVCNWLGLWVGMKMCEYLEMKTYSWRGFQQIPTYSGKVKRAVQQFTPHSWTKFDWAITKNFKHFLTAILLICLFLQGELNAFYLKYLLWIPPTNPLNTYRLILLFLSGTVAIRESYQYLTDPNIKKLGPSAWMCIAIVMTETVICIKFGKNEFHNPTPVSVIIFWTIFLSLLLIYALCQFLLFPILKKKEEVEE